MTNSESNPTALAPFAAARSLDELLRLRSAAHGDRTAYTFLGDGEQITEQCSYRELDARARRIAGWLTQQGYTGHPVLLVFPEGIDYVAAFFGCLYAGAIATPTSPPRRNRRQARIEAVVADSGARCVLTNSAALERAEPIIAASPALSSLPWQAVDAIDANADASWTEQPRDSNQPAFLQYTSGSTGTPKGVVVTHNNLIENQRLITRAFGQDESVVLVGWLPIYHDMGLIGNVLHPMYLGGQLVFMPPVAFLQKPIRWLQMISDFGGTLAGGPDFAFDLCARETTPEERAKLDLSKWQVAFNGSEPIHAATLRRFAETFADCGFREQSLSPCYGMAETTLLVSGSRKTNPARLTAVDAEELKHGRFSPAETAAAGHLLVGCGPPDKSLETAIVDTDTLRRVKPGEIGEVWLAGETVTAGYWKQPDLTKEIFQAEIAGGDGRQFLRTGDLGVVHDGELYITGRLKDVIIVRGVNHYPQDIERTVEATHEALVASGSAAFPLEIDGEERVGVAVEVERSWLRRLPEEEVFRAIRQAVAEEHELSLASVALLRTGSLPKTSSGKRQRRQTKQMFLDEVLKTVAQCDGAVSKPVATHAADSHVAVETRELQAWIIERIAARRGLDAGAIDPNEPFARYGLDSLAAVRLSGELSERLGRDIAPTLAFDYPTPAAVARYLISGEAASDRTPAVRSYADEPLAIVGAGCRFPGADDVARYWNSLTGRGCAIGPAPSDRWPTSTQDQPAMQGGFLPAIDQFDPTHFAISPREAEQMDPQQRLLLEVAWETLEHAGARPDQLRGQAVGVFVGVSSGDYSRLLAELSAETDPYAAIGGSLAIIANRLSYTLDFRGPSWSVDTACSSSLVAVHQAAAALRRGECNSALAGGVNLIVSDTPTQSLAGAGMLSPSGLCRAFCRGGDGFVRGEGCGLVLLKRLSDAVASGDRVLAVLRGTAVNQDGRSNGLTAPNGPAQQAVIRQALAASGLKPSDIDYVEAHGTGTELGDPTEMGALGAVFGAEREQPLQVGSAKTNVGHLEGAAGIAGLIKTCLSLLPRRTAAAPAVGTRIRRPQRPQPAYRLVAADHDPHRADALEANRRPHPPRRRQLVRLRRNQRPRDPRGGSKRSGRQQPTANSQQP